jgi:hypothetical protein
MHIGFCGCWWQQHLSEVPLLVPHPVVIESLLLEVDAITTGCSADRAVPPASTDKNAYMVQKATRGACVALQALNSCRVHNTFTAFSLQ